MNELENKLLLHLAVAAEKVARESGIDSGQAFDLIIEGIKKVPEQLQMLIDSIVAIQDEFPMSEEGWESFVESIEYTNQKHGLNLHIKTELLEK